MVFIRSLCAVSHYGTLRCGTLFGLVERDMARDRREKVVAHLYDEQLIEILSSD